MIKIEHIYTGNWEAAIRSMRNPLDSWNKSDSEFVCPDEGTRRSCGEPNLGPNDLKLAKTLANAGTDHRKFMRSIIFSCDITAPMYWWKEMDTYKVGTVRNSCSTMHTITKKEFTHLDFSWDKTGFLLKESEQFEQEIIDELNLLRERYIHLDNHICEGDNAVEKIRVWNAIIQYLPSSYNQKATWTANYEVLRNIYHARINHKLDEWHDFCYMIEDLPYSELITGEEKQ